MAINMQRSMLDTALMVAAERFEQNAKELDAVPGHARLAVAFRDQAKECTRVRNELNGEREHATIQLID